MGCVPCQALFKPQKPQGFLWYGMVKKPPPKPLPKTVQHPLTSPKPVTNQTPKERNEDLKAQFDNAVHTLVDQPTIRHAVHAQALQQKIMHRSQKVGELWALASLLLKDPTPPSANHHPFHRALFQQEKDHKQRELLKTLSKEWGLFLVHASPTACPYTKAFLPTLQAFFEETGFQVLAVSKEGLSCGPFPGKKDPGFIQRLFPDLPSPSLLLVFKDGSVVLPVAKGIVTLDEMKDTIIKMVRHHQSLTTQGDPLP